MSGFDSRELEAAVLRHVSPRVSGPVAVRGVSVRDLGGGYASQRVLRLDVRLALAIAIDDAESEWSESFVQKYTSETERDVLGLLSSLADEHPLPRLIGTGWDDFGSWVLMPFIEGPLHQGFSLPPDVVRTLAHVHSHFGAAPSASASLPRIDAEFWADALTRLETAARDAKPGSPECRVRLLEGVAVLREARQVIDTVRRLPATLLHGDVHPGNIIQCGASDTAVLFDWGNARVGPAGVDLTNCISSSELPEWKSYWDLVEQLTGNPVGVEERSAQFTVGRIITCLQYLPFAIEHHPDERSLSMMGEALRRCDALQSLG